MNCYSDVNRQNESRMMEKCKCMRKKSEFFRYTGKSLLVGICMAFSCVSAAGAQEDSLPAYIVEADEAPEVGELICQGQLKLDFAQQYRVYFYEGGYALLDITESGQYLLVPEEAEVPEGLDPDMKVLQQLLQRDYILQRNYCKKFRIWVL